MLFVPKSDEIILFYAFSDDAWAAFSKYPEIDFKE
jgi:hypothetical protein